MSTTLQFRRGNTEVTTATTGANGEIFINLETKQIHIHDGVTVGGHALANVTIVNTAYSNAVSTAATDATNKAANAYSNAVSTAATDATNKAANAYSNAVSYTDTAIANLIDTAPTTLNTLNELAAALGDDANFSTTILNSVGTAYSNAVSTAATDATNKAANAYSNAVSYTDVKAGDAYSNAVAYAASNTYVNDNFAKVTDTRAVAFGNTTITGYVNATSFYVDGGSINSTGKMLVTAGGTKDLVLTPGTNANVIANGNFSVVNTLYATAVSANGSTGTSGQVLTSDGTSTYWSTPVTGGGTVNVAAQYTWTNTHTFNANVNIANSSVFTSRYVKEDGFFGLYLGTTSNLNSLITFHGSAWFTRPATFNNTTTINGALEANSSTGSAGQVLTSNGTSVYWSTVSGGGGGSVDTTAEYNWTNNHTFNDLVKVTSIEAVGAWDSIFVNSNTQFQKDATFEGVVVLTPTSTLGIQGQVLANGHSGSAGQVLTSNGTSVYWSTVSGGGGSVNTSAQYTWSNTHTFQNMVSIEGMLVANGHTGTAGQVLTSDSGGEVYWSTISGGGFTNGSSISVTNLEATGTFTANSSTGTAGQVLASTGTGLTWTNLYININVDKSSFTGNGSNTEFTLSANANADSILVYVDGLYKHPEEDYTVNSNTNIITFSSAPVDQSKIRIRYLPVSSGTTTDTSSGDLMLLTGLEDLMLGSGSEGLE